MKTAAGLISVIVKFASGMQGGKDQTCCRHAFFMHSNGNTAPIILHCTGTICLQGHVNRITKTCQMLVHRIVNDFIDQMVQTFS